MPYLLFTYLSAIFSVVVSLGMLAAYLWISRLYFINGEFISPVYAMLAIILMGLLIVPHRFWREQRSKRLIKAAFAHYVSPEAVNRIAAGARMLLLDKAGN